MFNKKPSKELVRKIIKNTEERKDREIKRLKLENKKDLEEFKQKIKKKKFEIDETLKEIDELVEARYVG